MVTYVALLRGINVGGKNVIRMADLKTSFVKEGFENVSTYIQSGNVIFHSIQKQTKELEKKIERFLSKTFTYNSIVLVRSSSQIKKILSLVPSEWKSRNDLRCYIAFIKKQTTPQAAIKEVDAKEGIDFVKTGEGVLYMATLLSSLTKSGLSKLIGKKVYQDMTMRNYNTTQKIASLMEK